MSTFQIFGDIYWSDDMNEAWKELVYTKDFSKAVDVLPVGVCVQGKNASSKKAPVIQELTCQTRISFEKTGSRLFLYRRKYA